DIGETIGEEEGSDSAYIRNDGSFGEMNYDGNGAKGQEYYDISGPMSFAVNYAGKGILTGHGRCSTQPGVREFDRNTNTAGEITIVNNLTDETGQEGARYCYCQVDGFTPVGGTKAIVTSAPWVFYVGYDYGSVSDCADVCPVDCAYSLRSGVVSSLAWRAAVVGNIPAMPATCAANTINIDWNPDNNGEHIKNMCTYEGAIEVPADPVKPGYTFMGWKLVE
ncbi:MAG: InlB B-repeat-containing protein, partial [Alphaproteobacteria bacterium]|nr:InlB B-repeat-containing protein [Alphaproteobacteria bacterium]